MPGPKSTPTLRDDDGRVLASGKTAIDHKSGKWARRQTNRHADPVRERGGKQFGK